MNARLSCRVARPAAGQQASVLRHARPLCCARKGSLAVFFCIMLAALIVLGSGWLQAAQRRAAEASFTQAMAAQTDVTLASYERGLYDQFGLFAFVEDALDPSVFQKSLPPSLQAEDVQLNCRQKLLEPSVLDPQMVSQMKARLPGAWLDWFAARWSGFADTLSGLQPRNSFMPQAADGAAGQVLSPVRNEALPPGSLTDLLRDAFQGLTAALVQRTADYLFEKLRDELQAELEGDLLPEMRRLFAEFAATGNADGEGLIAGLLGGLPDFFNPQSLTGMAASLEQMLDFSTVPVYEKLCVVEYIMSYLTRRTAGQYLDGIWQPSRTPDGRSLQDLLPDRPAEIEQVVTGLQHRESAAATCRFIVVSIRSLLHVASILTDETRMAVLRGTAAALVAGVAAVSMGTVVVEPVAVTYLLGAAEALASGCRYGSRLGDGYGVVFWPGKGQVDFQLWYGDYLRLLLYCLPRALLVERTGRLLERLFPDPLYSALQVQARLGREVYALSGSYHRDLTGPLAGGQGGGQS